jgi:anti-repressor protein
MDIIPIVYNGENTYTTGQVDAITGSYAGRTRYFVRDHKDLLTAGVDYYWVIGSDEIAKVRDNATSEMKKYLRGSKRKLRLFTKDGVNRLIKLWGEDCHEIQSPQLPQETHNEPIQVDSVEKIGIDRDNKVDGRRLHAFLQVETPYHMWIQRMIEYGFDEGRDFVNKNVHGIREDRLTIDMAKELCMIQRTPRGKQARLYFIECEKKLKQGNVPSYMIDDQIQRAERWIAEQRQRQALVVANKQYQQIICELTPKADYTDKILQSSETMPITAIAKDYGMSAKEMNKTLYKIGVQYKIGGQWFLYSPYQNNGYTHSKTGEVEKDGVIVHTFMNTEWTQKGRLFLYNILKDKLGLLPMIERNDEDKDDNP